MWRKSFSNRDARSYPHATCLRANSCHGGAINLHCDKADVRHSEASSVLILGKDLKGRKIVSTVFSNDVCAGAHEVKALPIKGMVVGVSHGPAGTSGQVSRS